MEEWNQEIFSDVHARYDCDLYRADGDGENLTHLGMFVLVVASTWLADGLDVKDQGKG